MHPGNLREPEYYLNKYLSCKNSHVTVPSITAMLQLQRSRLVLLFVFGSMLFTFQLHGSEIRICNKGSVEVRTLAFAENFNSDNTSRGWEIRGWVPIAPSKCEVVWSTANWGISVVHLAYVVDIPEGTAIVTYDFGQPDRQQGFNLPASRKFSAICGLTARIERTGAGATPSVYKPPCQPGMEELPVSGTAMFYGPRDDVQLTVKPTAQDVGTIERIVPRLNSTETGPPPVTRESIIEGITAALLDDMTPARRFYNHGSGVWSGLRGEYISRVRALLEESIRIFGEEHVLATSAKVLGTRGRVPAPPELGNWQDSLRGQALMNHWASGSPKAFMLGQLRYSPDYESFAEWKRAEERYDELVSTHGEETILRFAARLRDAPKTQFLGSQEVNRSLLADPAALGCQSNEPGDCLVQVYPLPGDPMERWRRQRLKNQPQ